MKDPIEKQDAIDAMDKMWAEIERVLHPRDITMSMKSVYLDMRAVVKELPSAQPTLHGYNLDHLELIARVLQKEDLPPERVVEALTDIGRIVAIVRDEFEETLRRSVQNIGRRIDEQT